MSIVAGWAGGLAGSLLAQVGPGPGPEGAGGLSALPHPSVEYSALLPELILIGGALAILVASSMVRRRPRPGVWSSATMVVAAASAAAAGWLWRDIGRHGARRALVDAVAVDRFSVFFMVVVCTALVLGALVADSYLRREGLEGPEFYVLALLSGAGGMLMAAANDLLVLFLGLEVLSISLYVLAGYHRRRVESGEAAMKYFVLGAFSSALFLYGIALTYGATGSTNLAEIAAFLANNLLRSNGVLLAGMALLLVGLGFKVAVVPFHTWTPDVYQGAPTPATGFMAATAKAAGFAGLLRVFFSTLHALRLDWQPIILVLAIVTLLVGSVLAIAQTDIKRMLAYSSISHAGYVLIGLQAASARGIAGALFYLLAYTFMVLGSFAVVSVVGRTGDADHGLEAYRGLAGRRPGLALAFTVFLMAQAGVPFTTGFLAKFYVISAAVQSRSYLLAVVGMLAAAVAAFFYLRVVVLMYATTASSETGGGAEDRGTADEPPRPRLRIPVGVGTALAVTLAFTLVFGLLPDPVVHFAAKATLLF